MTRRQGCWHGSSRSSTPGAPVGSWLHGLHALHPLGLLPVFSSAMSSWTWQLHLAGSSAPPGFAQWRILGLIIHWHAVGPSPALTLPWAHSASAPGRGDIGTDVESAFMRDELLTNVSVYWLSGCITSSTRLYYEAMHSGEIGRLSATYCKARPRGQACSIRSICPMLAFRLSCNNGEGRGWWQVWFTASQGWSLMLSADSYRHVYFKHLLSLCACNRVLLIKSIGVSR